MTLNYKWEGMYVCLSVRESYNKKCIYWFIATTKFPAEWLQVLWVWEYFCLNITCLFFINIQLNLLILS